MRKNKHLAYVAAIDVILAGLVIYLAFYSKHTWEGAEEKRITIKQGETLSEIAADLNSNDIISSRTLFKLVVRLLGQEAGIKANTYQFKSGLSNLDVMRIITGKEGFVLVRYTLPPGSTLRQAANIAKKSLSLSPEKFLREAENDSLLNVIGLKGKVKNLEGFLYPESYDVSPGISEKELVAVLFSEFQKKVYRNEELMNEINKQETDLLKVVTLASIVEAETNIDEEKRTIAGVYLNRLKKGMKLEADPTVQYALPGGTKPRLLFEDLKIRSPYNTYLNPGLPPGPINNPDVSCIKAALFPETHNYLFFVATGNGGHNFSETYQEHLDAIKEYKKNLRNK